MAVRSFRTVTGKGAKKQAERKILFETYFTVMANLPTLCIARGYDNDGVSPVSITPSLAHSRQRASTAWIMSNCRISMTSSGWCCFAWSTASQEDGTMSRKAVDGAIGRKQKGDLSAGQGISSSSCTHLPKDATAVVGSPCRNAGWICICRQHYHLPDTSRQAEQKSSEKQILRPTRMMAVHLSL